MALMVMGAAGMAAYRKRREQKKQATTESTSRSDSHCRLGEIVMTRHGSFHGGSFFWPILDGRLAD